MDKEAFYRELVQELTDLRNKTTHICANLIETAASEEPLTGEFGQGYRTAQKELANMLRAIADGKITVEHCLYRYIE